MDDLLDTAAIFSYHKYMVATHGNTNYRALGWEDEQGQQDRFKVLAQVADLNHCSVLDAGCGHGDLRAFLGGLYPEVRYYGIEQIPEFVNLAIARYGQWPETLFYQGDFYRAPLPAVDYTLVSGSFNYRNSDPDFIFKAINKLFANSRLGLGFNFLSSMAPNAFLTSYSMERVITHCRQLSSKVEYQTNYLKGDVTVFMYG